MSKHYYKHVFKMKLNKDCCLLDDINSFIKNLDVKTSNAIIKIDESNNLIMEITLSNEPIQEGANNGN